MAKTGRTNQKGASVPLAKRNQGGPKKTTLMRKSEAAIQTLEEEAQDTVKFVARSIITLCKENNLKPGWALLGVCEFLAMMVHQNMPPEQYGDEIGRFQNYISDRLKEFNAHTITH